MSNQVVTIYTIAKGNYKFGAFALINSLRANGVENPIVVGTDVHLKELENVEQVTQVVLDSTWNGINLKPVLLLKQPADYFIYFDADIILTDAGLITEIEKRLLEDKFFTCVDGIVTEHEIRRHYWHEIYPVKEASGNPTCWYYNSGFFAGSFKNHTWILEDWKQLNQTYLDPEAYLFSNPKLPMGDQDTFNAVIQNLPTNNIASIQMPDWRAVNIHTHPFYHIANFRPQAFLHCTGKDKPWLFTHSPAKPPTAYHDLWYKYVIQKSGPVICNFPISFWLNEWFERSYLSRIIIKIKSVFSR
ncbi:MAG: hypothetical protein EOP42_00410 [Sphingobacteriaceae bacterium]|nr:MAG: hypothetical protein EOP42_00410 [Sphingobacteriaceae bacterium]